jgi:serine/threonine protein kinase/tetratricopeptide (TPR) repeat protein
MTTAAGTEFGPYRILEKIGSGGMGEVYRALDTRLERDVALKLVSESFLVAEAGGSPSPFGASPAGTPHSRQHSSHERFLREARAAATLSHPNICAIFDVGEREGRPYLVMELLRGETLKQYLAKVGGPLSADEVIAFSVQAASALTAAHARGIIHRDIKPANLFVHELGRKRQIKVLDFGLAKKQGDVATADSRTFDGARDLDVTATGGGIGATSAGLTSAGTAGRDLTSPGSTVGTVAYMSPEQAKGAPLDARTDLFSLGAVIYEMAAGRKAFAGESTAEVFAALLKENPAAVSSVNPAMPAGLDAVVAKLLAKDKSDRYASAEELQEDLEALERGSGASSASSSSASSSSGKAAYARSSSAASAVASDARPEGGKNMRGAGLKLALGALVVVLLIAGLAWWKYKPNAKASGAPVEGTASDAGEAAGAPKELKDSIILANFVNQTGDPVFDTTLNQALRIDLEQSPVIKIVSEDHLRQSVKYLGKPENTIVTPEIAREIGEREGMKAILTGTIGNLGKEYVVTLAAQNTATGDEIASEQATAPDKEHVLDALGKASAGMRAKLGESLASIKKLYTPFGETTTPSLEAFRAYALGDDAHQKGLDIPEAEGHYKRALEIDPNFAMAYARLGVIYVNSGQYAKSDEYFRKAYELSKHVSERERLYIVGHYEEGVTGNITEEIETLQEAIQTYPGQLDSYTNINAAYGMLGQYDKALPYGLKATQLQPDDAISSENLIGDYVGLGQMKEAQAEMARAHKLGMDSSTSIAGEDLIADFLLGDQAGVQHLVAQAAGHADEYVITQFLAATQEFAGQYKAAKASFERAYEQAGRAKAPDVQANTLLQMVAGRGMAGLCDGNEATVKQGLALDKSKETMETAALALAICGNGKLALPIMEELSRKYPDATLIQDVYLPLVKGFVSLAEGNAQQAVNDVEPTLPYDMVYPGSYVRGLAYLQLHDGARAVTAFQAATKSPGGNFVGSMGVQPISYALAQLGLARAYAMTGDKVNAKAAYEALFVTWKNADADLPPLVAAKKEYAAL